MAHKHAKAMMQYAEDAVETDRPWERWETRSGDNHDWVPCNQNMLWDSYKQYRRVEMIMAQTGVTKDCPLCGNPLAIAESKERNMEAYRNVITARTLCCGGLVKCYPMFGYTAEPYIGSATKDDWGE